jgi:hypothetical protein
MYSWLQTFAVFCMLYDFFWVFPRRLKYYITVFYTRHYKHCCSNTNLKPWDEKRTAPFWVITQRVVVISYRRFGTNYWSHFQRTSDYWQFLTDASGQPIRPFSEDQWLMAISYRRFGTTYPSIFRRPVTNSNFSPTFRYNLSVRFSEDQWLMAISYRRFGTAYSSYLQGTNV